MISARMKGLLALVMVFVAGGAVGSALTLAHPEWFGRLARQHRLRPAPGPETAARHFGKELGLDLAQQKHLSEIFLRHDPEMQVEIARARAFRGAFMARIFREIDPLLDGRQRERARDMLEQQQKAPFPPPPPAP